MWVKDKVSSKFRMIICLQLELGLLFNVVRFRANVTDRCE